MFLLLCLSSPPAWGGTGTPEPFAATRAEDLRLRTDIAGGRILIVTPGALYRLLPETEAWTVTPAGQGLPDPPLTGYSLSEETLWITGVGAAWSDARFDDWQRYGPGEGYPGRTVFRVEMDADYAWAATDGGAARFDRYVLEWETIEGPLGEPLGPVSDVAVADDRLWFALENGVAEYRKETESIRRFGSIGSLGAPRVLRLRQTSRAVWALTDRGMARYDKSLETWTAFPAGVDLPDARVHQILMAGEDVWLATDAGLWYYAESAGVWRRHESNDAMPGESVRAFGVEPGRIWVATERALAVYEEDEARWVDFTAAAPASPGEVVELLWTGDTLVLLTPTAIVYGLAAGQENPGLFAWRTRALEEARASHPTSRQGWTAAVDEAGLGVRSPSGRSVSVKGGATLFVEDVDEDATGASGLGEIASETRLDLQLAGRLGEERTLSGFYDSTTDPDNPAYEAAYRGARDDVLRVLGAGEIDEERFNATLVPGTGLRGAWARAELGSRSEGTRRRLLTADAWVGKRRTLPGRDVFHGGNRSVESSVRDVDYLVRQAFPLPDGWTPEHLVHAVLWRDDGDPGTDDPNTESRTLAGRAGSWDRLRPNLDYAPGPGGWTLLLTDPLPAGGVLAAASSAGEADLTESWLRNHYWIASDPIPGSLTLTVVDSLGLETAGTGMSYLQLFGLDADGDGTLDPERFSPVTGLLGFPEDRPFPAPVYDETPVSSYTIRFRYESAVPTFRLSHGDVVPGSERILVDRVVLTPGADYSLIPASGLFIFFEHVLLDEDSVIEVEYEYETDEDTPGSEGTVVAAQVGLAPTDPLFVGGGATRWRTGAGEEAFTGDLNARLEWKDADRFVRIMPEIAQSRAASRDGRSAGIGLQGRYRSLEVSASHRNLGDGFTSFEDRRTLLGRLREESRAHGRLRITPSLEADVEWEKSLSDSLGGADPDSSAGGLGEESSFTTHLRLLRSGFPNLDVHRASVVLAGAGPRVTKTTHGADLELIPDPGRMEFLHVRRLWLRAFFQRSEREVSGSGDAGAASDETPRTTDHAFLRLNGSMGSPLSWNLSLEDRRTFLPEEGDRNDRRFQQVDATLHSQPHSSLDAFARWQSDRDLQWHESGGGGGFRVERSFLGTLQAYPGRVVDRLTPLSLRLDLGNTDAERGEPGVPLPGAGSLWSETRDASHSQGVGSRVLETRLQVLAWLQVVERWEEETEETTRESLSTTGRTERRETRLGMNPSAGLVILRWIETDEARSPASTERRRFSGQWDQTWGGGFLTFFSLEAERADTEDRSVGERTEVWTPYGQVTWRRAEGRLDATAGGSLTWNRTKDLSAGSRSGWQENRSQSLLLSLTLQSRRILSLKMEYAARRAERAAEAGPRWETGHDVRIQVQLRA